MSGGDAAWPELAIAEGLAFPDALAKEPRAWLSRVLDAVFEAEGQSLALSVYLCGDEEIAALHGAHLGDAAPTDVISFPLQSEDEHHDALADGELVVGAEFAQRSAREFGNSWEAELSLYVVHGSLHLFGYDDHEIDDVRRMHAAELRVLRALGYDIKARYE